MSAEPVRVAVPEHRGNRSTTALGRSVVADALDGVWGPHGDAARMEADWRKGYITHFARLVESTASVGALSLAAAKGGLDSFQTRMELVGADGARPVATGLTPNGEGVETVDIKGSKPPVRELEVPYRGTVLKGAALIDQLNRWVDAGVVEPPFADAIAAVVHSPGALSLDGRPVVLMGAAAALGPLESLVRWGANVIAIDVPVEAVQTRIATCASHGAGRVRLPRIAGRETGLSLNGEPETVAGWLDEVLGDHADPVLMASFYADGGTHVELTAAHIAIVDALKTNRPNLALGYLATPTDAFLVPHSAVLEARTRWGARAMFAPTRATHALSGGRLFSPAYRTTHVDEADSEWGFVNTLVSVQGPNYALAKRVQRWHAMVAADNGTTVSANVAPSSWTTSVTKNKVLAATFRAAHLFGVEVFEPGTSAALMAAKLVADLTGLTPKGPSHPEALLSHDAAHGGIWRQPYEPLSALTVAGLIGMARR